ncbi:hypothetical protein [Flavobacterium suaedae]|nr:hypothetical protein [Flavobacterium suaedae]
MKNIPAQPIRAYISRCKSEEKKFQMLAQSSVIFKKDIEQISIFAINFSNAIELIANSAKQTIPERKNEITLIYKSYVRHYVDFLNGLCRTCDCN